MLVRFTAAADGTDATPGRTDMSGRYGGPPPDGWDAIVDDLAGLATSLGVESTARAAHEHGYHVTLATLATDAMTDLDPGAHEHTVRRVFPLLGETGDTPGIIELLSRTRS